MQIASFIDEALVGGESVLCHSLIGTSRCSLCMIVYFMYKYWWSLEKAFEFVCSKRPDLAPNPGFLQQLQIVDMQLQAARRRILLEGGQSASLMHILKACGLNKRAALPSPQVASGVLNAQPSKQVNMQAYKILNSKLFDWESDVVRQYQVLTGKEDSEELMLVNSYLNSQSNLTAFPGPTTDNEEHMATRLRWIDIDGLSTTKDLALAQPSSRSRNLAHSSTPSNVVAGVNKASLERPPNCDYSSFKLGRGWSDRERKIASGPISTLPFKVRSILKGGARKRLEQQAEFSAAAAIERGDVDASPVTASPEQRLNSMVKQYQEDRNSPLMFQKQQRSTRVGGLRDSIALAREKQNEGSEIMNAAAKAAATIANGNESHLARELARAQQEAKKHNISPTQAKSQTELASLELKGVDRQRLAHQLQSDNSLSSSSTPSVSIIPTFLLQQTTIMDNSSFGSLSSVGSSPIQRPSSAHQQVPSLGSTLGESMMGGSNGGYPKRPTSAGAVSSGSGVSGKSVKRKGGSSSKKRQQQQQQHIQHQYKQSNNVWAQTYSYGGGSHLGGRGISGLGMKVNGSKFGSSTKSTSSKQGSGRNKRNPSPSPSSIRSHKMATGVYGVPLQARGGDRKTQQLKGTRQRK